MKSILRVLWFSNSPGNSIEYLREKFVGSSWISALDKSIQDKVDLHVAFYYPKTSASFKYGATTYHPIGQKNWKLHVLLRILLRIGIYKRDLPRYLKIIDEIKPDIIHIHGTENPFGGIINSTSIPIVISIQGCLTVIERKFLGSFSSEELHNQLPNFKLSIPQLLLKKSYIRIRRDMKELSKTERWVLKNARYVIGRTTWDRRILSVLSPYSTYYHCEEIIREAFYKTKSEFKNNNRLVIHSTIKNVPYKGFLTICEALSELNQYVGINVEWRIAGILPTDDIVKISRRKLRDKFPSGLVFLGSLVENELVETLIEANIFVMPSHIENSSNSLCEAMLLGIPIIATYAGGTPSLIHDGLEGILVQDGDPWAMAGAILELANNPEMAITYGRNARNRALIRHNPEIGSIQSNKYL